MLIEVAPATFVRPDQVCIVAPDPERDDAVLLRLVNGSEMRLQVSPGVCAKVAARQVVNLLGSDES